jgi:polyvinyl alcohol dehydrogenase (cytochrome)
MPVLARLCAALCAIAAAPSVAQAPVVSGEAVYGKHCAACHDQVSPRVPPRAALAKLSPERVLRTLDFGLMMSVAYPLRRDEREAVARFVGHGEGNAAPPASAYCGKNPRILAGTSPAAWRGWSPDASNARFQNAAGTRLDAAQLGRLELKWAYGFPGDVIAFAAPTVDSGTLFVGSAGGTIQALDARSGCLHWTYAARGPVRSALTITREAGQRVLVFSDQNGWLYSLDARTGKQRWAKQIEAHEATRLTGAVAVHEGIAFVPAASWEETRAVDAAYPCCTFRGSLTAVRVRDGAVVWKTYLVDEPKQTGVNAAGAPAYGPSGAGVWSTPTIDAARGVVYVATGDNYSHPGTAMSDAIVALEMKSGRIVWVRQTTADDVFNARCGGRDRNCGPDHDYGAPAILLRAASGRDVLVAGQKSGIVYAFDPDAAGNILWQTRVGRGGTGGGVQWGMASDGQKVYAAVSDLARRRPEGLASGAGQNAVGDAQFEPAVGGGLTALDVLTGARVWFASPAPCAPPRPGCSPAQPGAVSAIPGVVFSGAMDGHIRAFSSTDGRVLWDFDTVQTFRTVNGEPAKGGSLDGAGAVVVGDMVFVSSGYPRFGGAPGNVLLAFGIGQNSR